MVGLLEGLVRVSQQWCICLLCTYSRQCHINKFTQMWSDNQQPVLCGQVSISSTLLACERVAHILHDMMTQTSQDYK